MVSKVTLHFVWGHLSRKQTVDGLEVYTKNIPFYQYFKAYITVNGAKWPLSALKCCETPKVSIFQSHFTQNARRIRSRLLEIPHLTSCYSISASLLIAAYSLKGVPRFTRIPIQNRIFQQKYFVNWVRSPRKKHQVECNKIHPLPFFSKTCYIYPQNLIHPLRRLVHIFLCTSALILKKMLMQSSSSHRKPKVVFRKKIALTLSFT